MEHGWPDALHLHSLLSQLRHAFPWPLSSPHTRVPGTITVCAQPCLPFPSSTSACLTGLFVVVRLCLPTPGSSLSCVLCGAPLGDLAHYLSECPEVRDVLGSSFVDLQSQVFSELHDSHLCTCLVCWASVRKIRRSLALLFFLGSTLWLCAQRSLVSTLRSAVQRAVCFAGPFGAPQFPCGSGSSATRILLCAFSFGSELDGLVFNSRTQKSVGHRRGPSNVSSHRE